MTITTLTRKTAPTGTGVLAALALEACGTTADNGNDGSASPGGVASSAVASTPATDDDTTWEVDVVVGEEVKELDVTADGDITVTDREPDPEDVQKAKEAEVTAKQALDTAREGRDGVNLDEMDLDDDNGILQWEVEFDREDGSDGPAVGIDATSGEVVKVDEH
ncbi:PepSY domain-containing protein [Micrococcus porci]|uniref:PepSY domain-containing protein n=1 Tax=Micrococcus porci TaxID=2856555 RepID=UPI003CE6FE87